MPISSPILTPALPAYKRIQSQLAARIKEGALKPGDVVPSERELARLHEVSLMTARHALAELEKEGLVERRRGAGTFVAPPRIHFNKLMSLSEAMAARGMSASTKVLHCGLVKNETEVAARLGLPSDSELLRVERLRQAADEPFALEICSLPASIFGDLSRLQLERRSLFTLIEQQYGIPLAYADEEVDATPAESRTAQLLAVQRGFPLLRIRQVIYSTLGKPAVHVLGLYRSDRHSLHIRRFR